MKNQFFFFLVLLFASCSGLEDPIIAPSERSTVEDDQTLEIVPINLEVEVIDGVLTFQSFQEMMAAMDVLANANDESITSWEKQIGFQSLYSEFVQIDNSSQDEWFDIVPEERFNRFYVVDEHDEPYLKHFGSYAATVSNKDGIVRVKDKIGVVSVDLGVWTNHENVALLVEALQNESIDESDERLDIYKNHMDATSDRSYLGIVDSNLCPEDVSFIRYLTLDNPDNSRKIKTEWEFDVFTSSADASGLKDYKVMYIQRSTSKKGAFRYKTRHWSAYAFEHSTYEDVAAAGSQLAVFENATKTTDGVRVQTHSFTIVDAKGRSASWLADNGVLLIEAFRATGYGGSPNGIEFATSCAMTHRGMDDGAVFFGCD